MAHPGFGVLPGIRAVLDTLTAINLPSDDTSITARSGPVTIGSVTEPLYLPSRVKSLIEMPRRSRSALRAAEERVG